MDLQASFGVLSEVIEQYESGGRSVRDVEATAADSGERLRATLSVPLCLCASTDDGATVRPQSATLTDGELRVEFDVAAPTPPETDAASVTVTDRRVRVVETGEVVLAVDLVIAETGTDSTPAITGTVSAEGAGASGDDMAGNGGAPADEKRAETDRATGAVAAESGSADVDGSELTDSEGETVDSDESGPTDSDRSRTKDSESGPTDSGTKTDELAAVRDESVPPYEDEPYLRRLYEVCDTFDEMRREIPMNVSAETVRRYMIEAGVHDPTTYDTASEHDAEDATVGEPEPESTVDPVATVADEQLLADGVGLPADLSIADVADAVVEAGTMYEVRDRLDLDPRRTRELLQRLDLIDLVMRRIGDDTPREVTHETVANRLRECTPTEPDAPTAT